MNDSTLFSVAPTFPLDDVEIRRRSRAAIAGSPVTWLAFVGAVGIGLIAHANVLGYLLLLGIAAVGLGRFWKARRPTLDARSMLALIRESNAVQDRELVRIGRQLELDGMPQYAVCLGRFLILKQKIESKLHEDRRLAPFRVEIESAVDGICAEVCREITAQCARERSLGEILTSRDPKRLEQIEAARRQSHAGILHAYTTLFQTHAEILAIPGPGLPLETGTEAIPTREAPPELHRMIDELRDETNLLSRTRNRIDGSMTGLSPANATLMDAGAATDSESQQAPLPPPLSES